MMHKLQYELDQLRREDMLRKSSQRQAAQQEKRASRAAPERETINQHAAHPALPETHIRETGTFQAV